METVSRLNSFLRGTKVLDLSRHLPGPLASLILADLGAEISKIEPPDGDEMRQIGPIDADSQSIYFQAINAGKTTRTIDLKSSKGRSELYELVSQADVLIESFRPGVMARLGADYDSLRSFNNALVYCSMSGYGQKGPLAAASGHDGNFMALSGILHRNGHPKPMYYDPPIVDCTASLFAVISILAALRSIKADGKGCHIDLALADSPMMLQTFQLGHFGVSGHVPGPGSGYLNGGAAYYQVYQTADERHIMLGAIERKFWVAFCQAAQHPEWIERQFDPEPQNELTTEVAAAIGGWSLEQCLSRFNGVDCGFSPVLNLAEAVAHPHHRQRGLLFPHVQTGLQALFPVLIDGQAPSPRAPLNESGTI